MKRYVTLVSGRESASRTLPRMRIGCGRLVAVLWTLLMKDTSHPGKHHEDRLFLRQTSSAPLQKRYGKGRHSGAFVRGGRKLWREEVYLVRAKRIRSGRATDEAGTLSEGEGRVKAQALGEESSGLPAGEGYSKPPAGTTRTAAGGFALAGVTQERERQGTTCGSGVLGHSCARTCLGWELRRSRSRQG